MSNCIGENMIFDTGPTYATKGNVCYKIVFSLLLKQRLNFSDSFDLCYQWTVSQIVCRGSFISFTLCV